MRQKEAINAASILGVPAANVRILGFHGTRFPFIHYLFFCYAALCWSQII
jgi:LmbE family N-acetylglucosaminyl deacetylase